MRVPNFSSFSTSFAVVISLNFSHSSEHVVVSHCGFNLHFSNTSDVEDLFMSVLAIYRHTHTRARACVCVFGKVFNFFFFAKVIIGMFILLLLSCKSFYA